MDRQPNGCPPSIPPSNSQPDYELSISFPTTESLTLTLSTSLDRSDDQVKLDWAHDVIRLVDRQLRILTIQKGSASSEGGTLPDPPILPNSINDLMESAVPIIISFTSHPESAISSVASYLKAHLLSTGSCPEMLAKDPRQAFKDFEIAARAGYIRGWFRLGRDYESCGEMERAKQCFERGVKKGDGECMYRMGMAHLMGQLNLPPSPETALPLLRTASDLCNTDSPQAAYVLGMLLAGEFEQVTIPPSLILPPNTPPCSALESQHADAKNLIETAAYHCFAPAQYKSGYIYEHASLTAGYDPLVSVQYYALASQNGEVEADMALSKWFLVGAEGCFEKNEKMARTFASKAAKSGLASGCFALGYYYELGIGGRMDVEQAKRWYAKAARQGNKEANARIEALSTGSPTTLSVQEHQNVLNNTLVRRRTAAKLKSDSLRRSTGRKGQGVDDELRLGAIQEADRASQIGNGDAGGGGSSLGLLADEDAGNGGLPASRSDPNRLHDGRGYAQEQISRPRSGQYYQQTPQQQQYEIPSLGALDIGEPIAFPVPHITGSPALDQGPSRPAHPPLTSSHSYGSDHHQPLPLIRPIEPRRATVPQAPSRHQPQQSFSSPNPYAATTATPRIPSQPQLPLQPRNQAQRASGGHPPPRMGSPMIGSPMLPPIHQPMTSSPDSRRTSYALQDTGPVAGSIPLDRAGSTMTEQTEEEYKGVGTFAEMGFQSKPVEDKDCVIM